MNKFRSIQVLAAMALLSAAAGPAIAGDCDRTKTVTVPFTWTVKQTGDREASFSYRNDGMSPITAFSESMFATIVIGSNFTPPDVVCSQLDPTPTSVTLNLKGHLGGDYNNPSLGFNVQGFPVETYVKFDGHLSLVPDFPQQSFGFGAGWVSVEKTATQSVGAGNVAYSGSVNVATKYGFGLPGLAAIQGAAFINLESTLSNPVVNIGFTVPDPIPEPASYAMLAAGLAAIAGWRRRMQSSARLERGAGDGLLREARCRLPAFSVR